MGKLLLLLLATLPALAQSTLPSVPIDVYDGFESSNLSPFWETTRLAPGALTLQSAITRAGHGAVQITVHANDKFEAGLQGDSDSERAELTEARQLTGREGVAYEQSFSLFFPEDFPIVPVRLVVAQWKQACFQSSAPCSDDSPVLAVRYIGGVLSITQDLDHHYIVLYQEKRDLRGRWFDLRFQVRFAPQPTGRVKAWLDGKQVIDFTGVTANADTPATGYPAPSYFYFKMGLYRNVMPRPMTIYIDEYRKKQLPSDTADTERQSAP
jgi:hypothetical protein